MIKKIISILISCVIFLSVCAGCQHKEVPVTPKKVNSIITIAYNSTLYGNKWIESITQEYKKKNPTITVKLAPDAKLDQNAGSILEANGNVPDILFLSNTNWQYWASKGYIENLTDLYKTTVDNKTTLEKKIQPGYLTHCKYKGKYWVYPWEEGVAGFLYNVNMFKQNNWTVPTTMQEFYELLPKIKAAGIAPIAWSGKSIGNWSYAVNNWWAQKEGRSGVEAYLKMGSPEVYHQRGRLDALKEFEKLVCDKSNSIENSIETDETKARDLFFTSKAAMLLGGSWVYSQVGESIPKGFNMGIMRFPTVDNAKDADINVSVSGGFGIIPDFSEHKSIAKDFLRFMSTDEMLENYTVNTSSPRPFNYINVISADFSDFGKNVMNIWNPDKNVYLFSSNPVYYNVLSDWPESGAPFLEIYAGSETPEGAFESNYYYVRENWSKAIAESK